MAKLGPAADARQGDHLRAMEHTIGQDLDVGHRSTAGQTFGQGPHNVAAREGRLVRRDAPRSDGVAHELVEFARAGGVPTRLADDVVEQSDIDQVAAAAEEADLLEPARTQTL